jgi:hypothetical protein
MALLQSQTFRWATAIVLLVLAATAVVGWAGGSDPLEPVRPALFGALLIAWLIPDLRTEPAGWTRRLTWFGVVAGAVLVVTSPIELAG